MIWDCSFESQSLLFSRKSLCVYLRVLCENLQKRGKHKSCHYTRVVQIVGSNSLRALAWMTWKDIKPFINFSQTVDEFCGKYLARTSKSVSLFEEKRHRKAEVLSRRNWKRQVGYLLRIMSQVNVAQASKMKEIETLWIDYNLWFI